MRLDTRKDIIMYHNDKVVIFIICSWKECMYCQIFSHITLKVNLVNLRIFLSKKKVALFQNGKSALMKMATHLMLTSIYYHIEDSWVTSDCDCKNTKSNYGCFEHDVLDPHESNRCRPIFSDSHKLRHSQHSQTSS